MCECSSSTSSSSSSSSTTSSCSEEPIKITTCKELLKKLRCQKKCECPKQPKKPAKSYHELGLVAKICSKTTDYDLKRLLAHDTRTVLVQLAFNTPAQLEQILLRVNTNVQNFFVGREFHTPIGLAFEIRGEVLRSGRMRNDSVMDVCPGDLMVLTTNEAYRYASVCEIVYVSHLWRYLEMLKVNDVVYVDERKVVGRVVKVLPPNVTLLIERGGQVNSYMLVEVPYFTEDAPLGKDVLEDVEFALRNGADFLYVPNVRSRHILRSISKLVSSTERKIKLLASLDFNYISSHYLTLSNILKHCEAVVITDMFSTKTTKEEVAKNMDDVLACNKPLIGFVPLRKCKHFEKLENHELLHHLDAMLIEKSNVTNKFPLIVKRLLPVDQTHRQKTYKFVPRNPVIKCIKETVKNVRCAGIVVVADDTKSTAKQLACPEVTSPVIVVVSDEFEAKVLNLRRNLKSVVFCASEEVEEVEEGAKMQFGIDFGKAMKMLARGDQVLNLYASKEQDTSALESICVPFDDVLVKRTEIK